MKDKWKQKFNKKYIEIKKENKENMIIFSRILRNRVKYFVKNSMGNTVFESYNGSEAVNYAIKHAIPPITIEGSIEINNVIFPSNFIG